MKSKVAWSFDDVIAKNTLCLPKGALAENLGHSDCVSPMISEFSEAECSSWKKVLVKVGRIMPITLLIPIFSLEFCAKC
jgi:hypothetical protein